jgi:hypothetical protein
MLILQLGRNQDTEDIDHFFIIDTDKLNLEYYENARKILTIFPEFRSIEIDFNHIYWTNIDYDQMGEIIEEYSEEYECLEDFADSDEAYIELEGDREEILKKYKTFEEYAYLIVNQSYVNIRIVATDTYEVNYPSKFLKTNNEK